MFLNQLENSVALRPLMALAQVNIQKNNSKVSQLIQRLLQRVLDNAFSKLILAALAKPSVYKIIQALYWLGLGCLFLATSSASTTVIAVGVLGCFTLSLLDAAICRHKKQDVEIHFNIIDALVGLFFLTAITATAFSSYTHTNIEGLFKFFIFAASYSIWRYVTTRYYQQYHWLFVLIMAIGLYEVGVCLYQYTHHVEALATWQDPTVDPLLQMTRVFGTLQPSNPNLLAGYLIPIMALVLSYALSNILKGKIMPGIFGGVATSGLVVSLILTGSRGGFLSLALMIVMLFALAGHLIWHHEEVKNRALLKLSWILKFGLVILIAIGGVLFIPAIQRRVLSIFANSGEHQDSSNAYRITVWKSTLNMIHDNWLFGIGPGNDTFKQVYGLYMTPGYTALSAYSIWLEIWAEQGILGFLFFLLLIAVSLLRGTLVFLKSLPLSKSCLIASVLTGLVGMLSYGLFDTVWYRPAVNIFFWFLLAILSTESERGLQGAN